MSYLSVENIIIQLLIAIPTFFILRLILKKIIKNNNYRVTATWVGTIILTPIIYIIALIIFFSILFHEPTKDFNKLSWLSDSTHRFQMADDLIKSKLLIGKNKNQVQQILGNPSLTRETMQQWEYVMGSGTSGLGFVFHLLTLKFENNIVVSAFHGTIRD